MNIERLKQLIIDTAGTELMPRFRQVGGSLKADGSLVTAADLAIQQHIGAVLAQTYPDIPLLGEEMSSTEQRQVMQASAHGFWCLDPLDGTANFVAGMPCFAISLAYLREGETRLGIVYDPMRDECFHAQAGRGAWLNGQRLQLTAEGSTLADAVAMVDFKRLPAKLAAHLASHPPYRSQRSIGSVALDWCWLAAGRLQLYLHGGQRLWDYAAGHLILAEAGGSFSLADGISRASGADFDLRPKVAKAATDPRLLVAWVEWLERHLVA